jgi:Haem-degrading
VDALAADPLPTETFKILPATLAVEAAEAVIASCKGQGYSISVTIVDRAGDLKLLLVGDGASALSRRKAYTSAMRRITTADLAKQVATPGAFNPTLYDTQMVTAWGWRAHQGSKRSAPSASVGRRAATRTKRAPMRASPKSVIGWVVPQFENRQVLPIYGSSESNWEGG